MKKFTAQEIRDLLNQVYHEEISFSRMVEIMNEMGVSEFKDGDFIYEDGRIIIVKSYPNNYHALTYPGYSDRVFYSSEYGLDFSAPTFRHVAEEEKQVLIDALAKDGKRWNAEKKCIEDIQQRKFKVGDKVRIKKGVSSETHRGVGPSFVDTMDKFIGKELTVKEYSCRGWVVFYGDSVEYEFAEDWLEPYVEDIPKRKFKVGDKVRIKDGVSSETVHDQHPIFQPFMDDFIGTTMTVSGYNNYGYVICEKSDWRFNEDWLEPYTDELKKGDLAIFWDDKKRYAALRFYEQPEGSGARLRHKDSYGFYWDNAIKFESKEQYERLLKGEI